MSTIAMMLPRIVVMEQDAIRDIADVLRELKLDGSGLIVCGQHTCSFGQQLAGILGNEYPAEVLIVGSASMDEVERVASRALDKNL